MHSRKVVGEKHLKLFVRHGNRTLPAIAFGMGDAAVEVGDVIDLLFSPELNEWNGNVSTQLRVRDFRPHQQSPVSA